MECVYSIAAAGGCKLGDTRGECEILVYYDPIFLLHDTGRHPENAARLLPTIEHLNSLAVAGLIACPHWQPASLERIQRVHAPSYVDEIKSFAGAGGGLIEQDTVLSAKSYEVALMASGAVCDAVEQINYGDDVVAFCLVRPPGHHAMPAYAMGFCLFNNVAVGARMATTELGYERVIIIDWDVHHGNGTQATFWEDPKVAYFSMHRDPFYPYTGTAEETGKGAGVGTTRNLPIKFGTPPETQLELFERELTAFTEEFKPQLVFISAGFDAHKDDPIGSLGLEAEHFAAMTQIVQTMAAKHASRRIISVLEGGYNPRALADCVAAHLAQLGNYNDFL